MKKLTILILALITAVGGFAQNTHSLESGQASPPATIEDVAWIAGHWRGSAMGGLTEEIWSPPLGGTMMGSFKLVVEDQVRFFKQETISEEKGSLNLKIKHFDAALTGWEEKDETVDFPLVKLEKNKAHFDGLTFELVSKDVLNIYVVMKGEDHETESKFGFKRFR